MQRIMRIAWLAYMVFLSMLLLTSDPARVIGVSGKMPWILRELMPWAHLLSFLVLAVVTLLARWPLLAEGRGASSGIELVPGGADADEGRGPERDRDDRGPAGGEPSPPIGHTTHCWTRGATVRSPPWPLR